MQTAGRFAWQPEESMTGYAGAQQHIVDAVGRRGGYEYGNRGASN
jgi:hypothetical protein